MTKGQSKTLKDVKQLEKRLAILEEENEILSRLAWQVLSDHLTRKKPWCKIAAHQPIFSTRLRACEYFKST